MSNRSDEGVYFDNFKVGIQTGNIIEENHYYAYGLKIAAISSRKFPDAVEGNLKNNHQYQGAFNELDDDIGWNDFALRNYDAQIGRWVQQDPYQEFASPYVGMGNDPANNTDPSGGSIPLSAFCPGTSAVSIFLSNVVSSLTNALSAASPVLRILSYAYTATSTAANVVKVFEVAGMLNNSGATIGVTGDPIGEARMQGVLDAWANATSLGFYDWTRHSHWNDYEDEPAQKRAYLEGRLMGDAAAIAQSDAEFGAGGGMAATGVGVVVGGVVMLHGGLAGSVASADIAKTLLLLGKLPRPVPKPVKIRKPLPSLDETGKVHGDLPKPEDLGKYSREELEILLKELKQSVANRIKSTVLKGPTSTRMQNKQHGERQAAEQMLIKTLEKYLKK